MYNEFVKNNPVFKPHGTEYIQNMVRSGLHLYGTRHSTEDETYNISIKNVKSRACGGVLHFGGCMKNVTYENIEGVDGAALIDDRRIAD